MSAWRKVCCCLAMVAGLSFGASAALTIGTTDDPKATEVDLGNDVYLLEFKNGNAEPWTFTPMGPLRVEKMLVVGGGGSGGCDCGAGGGGGAVLYTNYTELAEADRPMLSEPVSILVGAGGVAATGSSRNGKCGGMSEITVGGVTFSAYGGGGGGHWSGPGSLAAEEGKIASGGGKGNGGFANFQTDGKGYNSLYGHKGGTNFDALNAGGGGGAGGDGEDGADALGGKGGIGFSCDITGEPHLYGSGGCAARENPKEPYEGGGSRAAGYSMNGTDGLGGGGSGSYSSTSSSGAGGCGTVILVVKYIGDGKIHAEIDKVFSAYDGASHTNTLTVYSRGVTVKWALAEDGPFDLDEQPGFTEIGIHSCWCRLTASDCEPVVLKGMVYIRGDAEPLSVGVADDPGVVQYSFGEGHYVLGFTNFEMAAISVSPLSCLRIERMLVVGGGGSGGNNCGGGGGGGGVIWQDYRSLPEAERPTITNEFGVTIGRGGSSALKQGVGQNGNPTTLTVEGVSISAWGGGGGGSYTTVPAVAAVTGQIGSGGGASFKGGGSMGVDGIGYNSKQGKMGGAMNGAQGAGGGGAGSVGGAASATAAGRGGDGFACKITGETHLYGSGGGGGNGTIPDPPEGGGRGGNGSISVTGGTDGLGGGGGGSKGGTGDWPSGSGGAGCVYLHVTVVESPYVSAVLSDCWGSTAGEAHSNELIVATAGVTTKWSLTGAEGPFDLDVQPSFATPGIYTNWCELTAAGKETLVLRGIVGLRAADGDYYVAADGDDKTGLGTADRPFATPEKALANVRDGYGVRIGAGKYKTFGLVLDRAVALVGDESDPSRVVIDAGQLGRTLKIADEAVRVSGVTIKGGFASSGANVYMTAGVVSNCVLTGGNGSDNGGNAYVGGGQIVDSQILNGSARRGGGAAVSGRGRILRCLFKGNSVTDSGGGVSINGNGVVENSFFTGNSGRYGSGVQLDSMDAWLVNCTVAGNAAGYGSASQVWNETNGGNALNCVVLGGYYIKKGTISYCALDLTPREETTGTKSYDHNVTVDSSIFEDTTAYRPKKGTDLQGKGSNLGYSAHAVSTTDYEGSPRRQGARIDIGHIELPPKDGTLLFVR